MLELAQGPSDRSFLRLSVGRGFLVLVVLIAASTETSEAGPRYSSWWEKVEAVEQDLREERYKPAAKAARKWVAKISKNSWNDPELAEILAELSLYQAIAAEHLGDRQKSIWYWQMAQNIDPKIRNRDLNAYGVGELFYLHPRRKLGQAPAGIRIERARMTKEYQPAKQLALPAISMELINSMAARSGSRSFEAEFVVDERGHVIRPVVKSIRIHPIILYAALESFYDKVLFEPARLNDTPVATLMPITLNFKSSRW